MQGVARCLRLALLVASSVGAMQAVRAQEPYPSKPVRIVVGFAAGGPSDVVARILSQPLADALGQPVIVENRPGADGAPATEFAARAPADGYTILQTTSTQVINMVLKDKDKVRYDLLRDFLPIARTVESSMVLVIPASSPIRSVAQLVAYARARPTELNYGSGATGSVGQLSAELFKRAASVSAVAVPYKGNGPLLPDLFAGRLDFAFLTQPDAVPNVSGGLLRALAVTAAKRVPTLPDVPTMIELGYRGFESSNAYGYMVPAGTPPAIVRQLQQAILKAAGSSTVQDRLQALGLTYNPGGPAELTATVKDELERWGAVIKAANIRAD